VIVLKIRKTEMTNWKTTRPLRRRAAEVRGWLPFPMAVIGLKPEAKKAG
jgi:hypothetical protein